MNRPKPPVDLDKNCEGRSRNFVSYQDGARMYGMSYWGFVRLCQEIEANIPLRKTSIVDTEIVDAYIESLADENTEKKEKIDMARKKCEDLEDLIKLGKTIIVVTHDEEFMERCRDDIVNLSCDRL